MNALNYINDHWDSIVATLASIAGGARLIVKLSPTPKPGTVYEALIELLKHIALSIPEPKGTVTTAVSNVVKDASKTVPAGLLIASLMLGGCAGFKTSIANLVATVKTDLPGWETAANALWTKVSKVGKDVVTILTSSEFDALMTSFGVSADTAAKVKAAVTTANGDIQISQNIVSLIDSTISTATK